MIRQVKFQPTDRSFPKNAKGEEPPPPALQSRVLVSYLATLTGSRRHDATDLREDRADRRSNARHNRTGGHGHETSHQSVFDEVLTARIFHHFQLQQKVLHSPLRFSSPYLGGRIVCRYENCILGGRFPKS